MEYSFISHLKYLMNYSKTIVHLQMPLSAILEPKVPDTYSIRNCNPSDNEDVKFWCSVVENAYQEGPVTIEYARKHFSNHLFLKIDSTYFLCDKEIPIATISVGTYLSDPNWGGDARIAVKQEYQGKGLGKFLICYGFIALRNKGVSMGESIISIPRTGSILMHFKCGFAPNFNRHKNHYNNQKRSPLIRLFVNVRLKYLWLTFNLKKKYALKK